MTTKKAPTKSKASTAAKKPVSKATKSTKAPLAAVTPDAPIAAAPAPEPTVVDAPKSVILGPVLRKKELIAAVVARSGVKKKDAKPVVESMLAVLGEALADNRELNLPPLGKVKVRREKQLPNAQVMVVKVRQPKESTQPAPKMPDAAE